MSVGKIGNRVTYTATTSESVRHAAIRMQEHGVGTLVVVDDDERPIGMLTDRDIVVRCLAERLDPDTTQIGDVMSVPVCSLLEDTPIESGLATMARVGVRRAAMIDPDGRLTGVLAVDDVLELLAEEVGSVGALLRTQVSI